MSVNIRGEGTEMCIGMTSDTGSRTPRPCGNHEIEGLEYCLHHMPDDLLEEAEQITGMKRCRHYFGQPDACTQYAVARTAPPMCKIHGANKGSYQHHLAIVRQLDEQVTTRIAELLAEGGEKLIRPAALTDPYGELMQVAGEMKAWKDWLAAYVSTLRADQFRYAGKAGEQQRAEVMIYERAIERYAQILVNIARLNLDARLVGIREQTADMMERALDAALTASGMPLENKIGAREAFRRNLKIVA